MTRLEVSEAQVRLIEIAEQVATTHERVEITSDGLDYVVLLAAEDLESIEATLELLSDPEAQARIAAAGQELARGEALDESAVRNLMRRPPMET